jgi:hypothetical protein
MRTQRSCDELTKIENLLRIASSVRGEIRFHFNRSWAQWRPFVPRILKEKTCSRNYSCFLS